MGYDMDITNRLTIALYILISVISLILLKLGTSGGLVTVTATDITLNITPLAIIGILCYGFSFLIYTILISRFDLGFIVSITTAFIYIIVFIVSFFMFEEQFTLMKIIAIGCILSGLIILNLRSKEETDRN